MKKISLITIALFISIIGYSQTFTDNNITYEVTSTSTVKTKDYNMAGGTIVNIPATVTNNSISYSVTEIGVNSFKENQLTSVTIPNSVTKISTYAFYINNLTSITIPNSVTTIEFYAFYFNQLTTVTLPDSVTTLGIGVFQINNITSFTFPAGITSIPSFLLSNNLLTSITIPNTITSIEKNAFTSNQLTNITIPNSVTSIGESVFKGNPLTNVTSLATTPPTITTGGNLDSFNSDRSNIDLTIPTGTVSAYVTDAVALWTGFKTVNGSVLSTTDFEFADDIKLITTANKIKVTFSNNLKLQNYKIYNISGVEVSKGTQSEIPTNALSSGIYILKLDFDKGTFIKKVLIN